MVKSVGFDPETETKRMKALRFVLWSWRDMFSKILSSKGRTSRAAFFVIVVPVAVIWLGIASWFSTTKIDISTGLYGLLVTLRLAFGGITVLMLSTLTIRRLHDCADESNELKIGILFFGPATLLFRLLVDSNPYINKHGPPHVFMPSKENTLHDPKQIG